MRGQMSNFPEIDNFSDLQARISRTINRIATRLSSSCSTFHSELNGILLWHLDQIFVMYSTPEGIKVIRTGKIARGQTWQKALIGKRP